MNLALITRRALVTTGVTIGLVAGSLAIRTAAEWASAASSTAQQPPGIQEIAARIAVEETRSAALRAQIERLAVGSDQLAQVIALANLMAEADEAAADALKAELVDTKERLASLEPAPQPARAPVRRTATTTRTTTTATLTRTDDDEHEPEGDEKHEREHDDD